MEMDPLSDVLRVVRLSGGLFFRLHLSAPYSVGALDNESLHQGFSPHSSQVFPFHLITQGPIWFSVEGEEPIELQQGDIIVLPHGAVHAVADAPGQESVQVVDLQESVSGYPPTLTWGGSGAEARVLCGFFNCFGRLFNPLLESLPQVIVLRADSERTPWLAATLERTFDETLESRSGGAALVERLTSLLFLDVVQGYLEDNAGDGWLAGLADPVVGKVLQLIHQQPAHSWSVEELARSVGVSRSILADRFAETVGMAPIRYLTGWRMELAANRLIESNDPLIEIAGDVGYESEASFSRAFKRYVGEPPAGWRNARKQAAAPLASIA